MSTENNILFENLRLTGLISNYSDCRIPENESYKSSKMVTERYLSPKKFAAALGVSESSVKRWADEGKIESSRTEGGHRRISRAAAYRYIRANRLPLADPAAIGIEPEDGDEPGKHADALIDAVKKGDERRFISVLTARYLAGENVATLFDGPVADGLHQIGDLWRHGPEGIHIEHRSTEVCIQGLSVLRSFLSEPAADAPLAIGCSPSGDPYRVASLMASIIVAEAGWRDRNLGADLPIESLVSVMETERPRLLWLSFTSDAASEAFLRKRSPFEEKARELQTVVVAGGRAFPRKLLKGEGCGYHFLSSMEALDAFARALRVGTPSIGTAARVESEKSIELGPVFRGTGNNA